MKNWPLWMILILPGFCLGGVADRIRLRNDLVITPSASPHDENFRRSMLKKIREISMADLDGEKISRLMGWPEAKRLVFDGGDTTFKFNIYSAFNNPSMTVDGNGRVGRFDFWIDSEYVCLTGEDVVAEFGNEYKKSLINRDTFSDFEDKSYYKSENFTRFGSGPVYEAVRDGVKVTVVFSFGMHECLNSVFISRKAY